MEKNSTKREKKSSNFLVQGSILAVTGILVRIIGILYRVPLIRIIGDEGMGYYNNAFLVYSLMLLLSSYSLPLAVSKMVAARLAKGQYRNMQRIFKASMFYATVVGATGAFVVWFGADFFATRFFPMPYCVYALRALAPTIWVMAYLGVLRGYFQGHGSMVPTAVSQLLEQILNAVVSVVAAGILFQVGLKSNLVYNNTEYAMAFGAAGGTIGTGAGAFIAFIILALLYISYRHGVVKRQLRRDRTRRTEGYGRITLILFATVLPVILSTAVYNVNGILDSSIFGHCLTWLGQADEYTVLIGIYAGKYQLLINVPVAIASALSASLIPPLARAVAEGSRGQVLNKVNTSIRFAMIVAIPSTVGLTVLAGPVCDLLFPGTDNQLCVNMLMAGSLTVVFYSLSTISNAILQGINHMNIPIRNALIALLLHLVALVAMTLVLRWGIYSVVFANMLFAFLMCVFNGISIARYLNYRQEIKKTFLLPVIAAGIMGAAAYGTYQAMHLFAGNAVSTVVAIAVAVMVYGVLLIKIGCVDEVELYGMPAGGRLVRIARKLHLL